MSDIHEIASMFRTTNLEKEATYRRVEYVQVQDQSGGGVYPIGQVAFNLQPHIAQFSVLADSFLVLPLQITNATAASVYAIKNSFCSLIHGLQVSSSSGTTIINEIQGSTGIMSNLRMLVDSSLDYIDMNEMQYFGHDQNLDGDVSGRHQSVVSGVFPKASSFVPTIDPQFNPALASRITVFNALSTKVQVGGTAVYQQNFVAYLPLKLLHPWFEQMNFPINNTPFFLTFNVAGAAGYTGHCPFTCPTFAPHSTMGNLIAPAPLALAAGPGVFANGATPTGAEVLAAISASTLAAASITNAVPAAALPALSIVASGTEKGFTSGVRLYLKIVTFHDDEAALIVRRNAEKFRRAIVFPTTSLHSFAIPANAGSSATLSNLQIGTQYIRPTRVWVLPILAGTRTLASNTFPACISASSQYLTNTNLSINGVAFYQSNLRSQYEFYRLLRDEMVGGGKSLSHGTPISYSDFMSGINPYCFNISRDPSVDSNLAVSLSLTTDIAVPAGTFPAIELLVIVECLNTHIFETALGATTMTCPQGVVA